MKKSSRSRGSLPIQLAIFSLACIVYAPIASVIMFSFSGSRRGLSWSGFTTEWYCKLVQDGSVAGSFKISCTVALLAAVLSAVIGGSFGIALGYLSSQIKGAFGALLILPIAMPDLFLGSGILIMFRVLELPLGVGSVVTGHSTFGICIVALTVAGQLSRRGSSLELAAADLGASPVRSFLFVTVPGVIPAILASSILVFLLSWDDFMVAFFLAGVGATTLPLKIFSMLRFGVAPSVNALASLVVAGSFVIMFVLAAVRRRQQTTRKVGEACGN